MGYRIRNWDKLFENAASRKLKRLDWVAVPNKTDGEGYMELVDHQDGAAHLGAWYAIVEAASKQKVRGNLPGISQDIGGICRALGKISQLPAGIFMNVIPRLLKIGWIEQAYENQPDTESATSSAENPNVLAESADDLGESQAHREGKGITGNGTEEQKPFAQQAALVLDSESAVRSNVPAKKRRKEKRTTEEVRAALGERAVWFDQLWKVGPWTDGKLPGMDTYERRVGAVGLAREVHKGAVKYAAKCAADPTLKVKFLQGWLNDERWHDENAISTPAPGRRSNDFVADVSEVIQGRIARGEEPW